MTASHPRVRLTLGLALLVSAALTACTASPPPPPDTSSGEMAHVHGVGADPATGDVYIATHSGTFRLPGPSADAVPLQSFGEPIASLRQDTMGFTMSEGIIYGSGHPDPSLGLPPNLGLITSSDGARTWQSVSETSDYDFHDLAVVEDGTGATIYGYDAARGQVSVSQDGGRTWAEGATIQLRDLTVVPDGTIYATTAEGLAQSTDGGNVFNIVDAAPDLYLVQALTGGSGGLIGISTDQRVWLKPASGTWAETGKTSGPVEAMASAAEPTEALITASNKSVEVSYNLGATWMTLVRLP